MTYSWVTWTPSPPLVSPPSPPVAPPTAPPFPPDGTSVTVPAGSSAKVAVKVSAPEGIGNGDFYGGYVTLTPDNAAQTLRIPFVGVGGNLAESKTLYKTGPVLATEKLKVVNKAGHQSPCSTTVRTSTSRLTYR